MSTPALLPSRKKRIATKASTRIPEPHCHFGFEYEAKGEDFQAMVNKPESMHGLIRVPYASSHEGDGFTKYRLLTNTSPLPNRLNQIQGNGRIALVIRTRTGSRPSLRALQGCFRSRRTWRTQPGQCSIYLLSIIARGGLG